MDKDYKKLYEEALERAKIFKSPYCQHAAEVIFPELKESEDEKIRKYIIWHLKHTRTYLDNSVNNHVEEAIAWLEKQGEQKSWSEEDEYQINTILHGLDLKRELYKKEGNKVEEDRYNTQYNWLKSIKNKVATQEKVEWSEDDEKKLRDVIRLVEQGAPVRPIRDHYTDWLKSLKDRFQLQPKQEWSEKDEKMWL